jgi:K+-sensing histidine kinase KdpD
MNLNKQNCSIILFAAVISSSLVFATSIGRTVIFQGAVAQQQQQQQQNTTTTNTTSIISNQTDGIANQTGEAVTAAASMQNQTMTNQTGGGAATLANLTQTDFESITENLAEARQALQNNDTSGVLDELSSASEELFQLISGQFDPDHVSAITEQFKPLQTHIDQARGAALKNNHTETLEEINSADSELLKITQELPPSEE